MEIAGNKCKICKRDVVLSVEGKLCTRCGTVVHLTCEPGGICGACGEPYHGFEPPKSDPFSVAIVPRALRPAGSGGPTFVMVVGIAFLLLAFPIWSGLHYALKNGH